MKAMGLEELTFGTEGIEVTLKAEVHRKHYSANFEYPFAEVPAQVKYINPLENKAVQEEYSLSYDLKQRRFVSHYWDKLLHILSITEPDREDVLHELVKELEEMGKTYATLLSCGIVKEKNYFRNSQGEWKDIGDWLGVYNNDGLLKIADAVK